MQAVIHYISENANSLYIPLTLFVLVDYITGVCLALKKKKVSSKIGFMGVIKKALIYLVALLGRVVDLFVLSSGAHVESMVIFFYLSNEGISILENLTRLGVPFPEKMQQIFDDLGRDSPKKN